VTSSFAWVDFSDEDRQRMSAVVQLFQESETVDELGLGVVRDVFANLLFPGTSTIQTRARYFLFVPWIYKRHEQRGTSAADVARRAREDEIRVIEALLASGEKVGVIGAQKRAALKGLPSSIYWAGLAQYGIRRFLGSQDEYHRSFDSRRRTHEANGDDDASEMTSTSAWDASLPSAPAEFPKKATLALTEEEAQYLADKIDALQPRCLLSILILKVGPSETVDLPWLHPDVGDLNKTHQEQLEHARNFSEVFYGASVLYNLMLAELQKNDELVGAYRTMFDEWMTQLIPDRRTAHRAWDRRRFWDIANAGRIDARLQIFIDTWLALVLDGGDSDIRTSSTARELIRDREWHLKRNRARLHNQRALERWTGQSGAFQANYRWNRVRAIVGDIRRGLGKRP
jgi:hypothetical protein